MRYIRRQFRIAIEILHKTHVQFDRDHIPAVAAGATFFILLAFFPAFASIVTLYGFLADRSTIAHELNQISPFLPRGAIIVLNAELHRLIAEKPQKLGLTFIAGTFIALWSASGGLKAVVDGLNVAYKVSEGRSFLRRSLISLLLTVMSVIFTVVAIALAGALAAALRYLPFHGIIRAALPVVSWPIAYCVSVVMLAAIYTYGPNRPLKQWRWVTGGSLTASALWLLGTAVFKWYVALFGNFDRVYGSLGAIVGFLTWIWLSLLIVLFGAELNSELERRERAKPQGADENS